MPHFNIIQIRYDEVMRGAALFRREAAATEDLINQIEGLVGDLEAGGWLGRGANAYYAEMHQEVLPALRRMAEALDFGGDTLSEIHDILSGAEQEAARLIGPNSVVGPNSIVTPNNIARGPGRIVGPNS